GGCPNVAGKGGAPRRQLVAVVDELADQSRQQEDGRCTSTQEPHRAGARPLRDDAVMDMPVTNQDVLTFKQGLAGRLRLNRPRALHSLNRQMVRDMANALIEWRDDPDV